MAKGLKSREAKPPASQLSIVFLQLIWGGPLKIYEVFGLGFSKTSEGLGRFKAPENAFSIKIQKKQDLQDRPPNLY